LKSASTAAGELRDGVGHQHHLLQLAFGILACNFLGSEVPKTFLMLLFDLLLISSG
jgi:hypothetical protein